MWAHFSENTEHQRGNRNSKRKQSKKTITTESDTVRQGHIQQWQVGRQMFEQSCLLVDILDAVELLQFIFLQSKWSGNGRDRRKDRLEVGPGQKDEADVKEYQQKSRLDRWFHRDDA